MISLLINILIAVVILIVIWQIVRLIVGAMGLPAPTLRIVDLVFGLIALLWLLAVVLGPGRVYVVAVALDRLAGMGLEPRLAG